MKIKGTPSYTPLTAYTAQAMRKHLVDTGAYRAAGNAGSAHAAWIAASAVYGMWTSLVVERLSAHHPKGFLDDFKRLEVLMDPTSVPIAAATAP